MDNYLLLEKSKIVEDLSRELGFTKTFFLDDFVFLKEESKKKLLNLVQKARNKKQTVVYQPPTAEMARFAVEKTNVHIIVGVEKIHPKDSVHHVRSGLDQVICKFAAASGKIVAFSFTDVLHVKDQGKVISRMKSNVAMCRKYKVKTLISSFARSSSEMRSSRDLTAFFRMLQKTRK
jgi:RNase P/RNase MRP subunit p30